LSTQGTAVLKMQSVRYKTSYIQFKQYDYVTVNVQFADDHLTIEIINGREI